MKKTYQPKAVDIVCSKCNKKDVGLEAHVGKFHKSCIHRKEGMLRNKAGKWEKQ